MSTNRSRRIDRDTAEHLLGGVVGGTQGGRDPLADLLAAAASPGTARELAGEEAALTAFREAARLAPVPVAVPRTRRRSMAACAPARLLSAKVAAAALAATALGGVAVAASTGNLPVALGGSPAQAPAPGGPDGSASASGSSSASAHGKGPSRAAVPTTGGSPAQAALLALCHSWGSAGKATADPRFDPLIHAANGADQVGPYCADLQSRPADQTPGADASPSAAAPTGTTPGADRSGSGDHPHPGRTPEPSESGSSGGQQGQGGRSGQPTPAPTDDKSGHSRSPDPASATASGHAR